MLRQTVSKPSRRAMVLKRSASIGGEPELHRQLGHVPHDVHHIGPHQGFAAGKTDLGDAVALHEEARDGADLFPRHQLLPLQEVLVLGHAVGTT